MQAARRAVAHLEESLRAFEALEGRAASSNGVGAPRPGDTVEARFSALLVEYDLLQLKAVSVKGAFLKALTELSGRDTKASLEERGTEIAAQIDRLAERILLSRSSAAPAQGAGPEPRAQTLIAWGLALCATIIAGVLAVAML